MSVEPDVSRRLLDLLAAAIGEDRAENIDIAVPMVAIGLDSLQALELRRRVKLEFNHDLEVGSLGRSDDRRRPDQARRLAQAVMAEQTQSRRQTD